MIQDISPRRFDPSFRPRKPEAGDFLLHYERSQVMLRSDGRRLSIPTIGELSGRVRDLEEKAEYLFSIDDRAYYLAADMTVPESQ